MKKIILLSIAIIFFILCNSICASNDNKNVINNWKQTNDDGFGNLNNLAPRGIEVFENC